MMPPCPAVLRSKDSWRSALVLMAAALLAVSGSTAASGAGPVITEFPLERSATTPAPFGITAGPDGNLWFTSPPDRLGVMSPAGVLLRMITVPPYFALGRPNGIVAGPDGNVWFCETGTNKIGRITPAGALTEFALPTPGSGPLNITVGPDGALWFTQIAKKIGRITTAGTIREYPLPARLTPVGITLGPDGNLWFTDLGLSLVRMTPQGAIQEFPIPFVSAGATEITTGPDGNLWFVLQQNGEGGGLIGRMTPTGVATLFPLPLGGGPLDIAAGADGNLWFTETVGKVGSISASGQIAEYAVPSLPTLPAGSVSPAGITPGPDGNLWFTDLGTPGIGRISPVDAPCVPSPTTLCIDDQPNDRRWQLTISYDTLQGGSTDSGSGKAISLQSLGVGQGGLFWFFDPANPEMLVKVVNACALNQHFWIFSAATTNVGFNLTVRDTQTGATKSYRNTDGHAAVPVQDTAAFACGAAVRAPDPVHLREDGTDEPQGIAPVLEILLPGGKADCVPGATQLCLDGRFAIQVAYQTAQAGGLSGPGRAISLQSLGVHRGGLFWFFGATNPEMLIKVIDGCAFNNHFWVFYAAITNVGFTVTVTDQQTGRRHQYTNSDGHAAAPVLDTTALSCSP